MERVYYTSSSISNQGTARLPPQPPDILRGIIIYPDDLDRPKVIDLTLIRKNRARSYDPIRRGIFTFVGQILVSLNNVRLILAFLILDPDLQRDHVSVLCMLAYNIDGFVIGHFASFPIPSLAIPF